MNDLIKVALVIHWGALYYFVRTLIIELIREWF